MTNRRTRIRKRALELLQEGRDLAWGQALAEARREINHEVATGGGLTEAREPITTETLEEARERLFSARTPRPEISDEVIEEAASRLFGRGGGR